MKFRTLVISVVSTVALAACGETGKFYEAGMWNTSNYTSNWDIDEVAAIEPAGNAFQTALYKEYLELAKHEFDETDLNNTGFFLNKARASARGEQLGPQRISARNLTDENAWTLGGARQNLVSAIVKGNADVNSPDAAARAQAMFDCWMEESEENIQSGDISRCKAGFDAAMKLLVTKKIAAKAAPAPVQAPAAPAAPAPLPGPYIVYFDFDSTKITDEAMGVIKQAAADYVSGKATKIILAGHTDRSGASAYNVALSERRVSAIADALASEGIPSGNISTARYGEDRPMINTPDGKREAVNRRVEIELQR